MAIVGIFLRVFHTYLGLGSREWFFVFLFLHASWSRKMSRLRSIFHFHDNLHLIFKQSKNLAANAEVPACGLKSDRYQSLLNKVTCRSEDNK